MSTAFEGVEKRLELSFTGTGDLRKINRSKWDEICFVCKCSIVRQRCHLRLISFVLSESSLFVFKNRFVLKTCGNTVPLFALQLILSEAYQEGLLPLEMTYSHGQFMFPQAQPFPHCDNCTEIEFLAKMDFGGSDVSSGSTHIIGGCLVHHRLWPRIPLSEYTERRSPTIDVMMTGLSKAACEPYWMTNASVQENENRMAIGLRSLIHGFSEFEGVSYNPCGYSINAIGDGDEYMTIHITPEEEFSYASVETNTDDINILLSKIIKTFEPMRLCLMIIQSGSHIEHFNLPHRLDIDEGSFMYDMLDQSTSAVQLDGGVVVKFFSYEASAPKEIIRSRNN